MVKVNRLIMLLCLFVFASFLFGCNFLPNGNTNDNGQENNSNTEENNKIYYLVTFDSDGGSAIESQSIEKGSGIEKPVDPIKEGYSFDGWYADDEKWSFNGYVVSKNITLKAKWNINQYTLTIKYNDGVTSDLVIKQDYNTDIQTISNPTREGYTFDKWSSNIPTQMPAQNLIIEASWKINQYTLTIKYNDGITSDLVIKQDYNTDIQAISAPTKEYYTFDKWSSSIPTKMPATDLTIEAVWKINQYTITLKYNDEATEDLVIKQDYNSDIQAISNPTREGYTFEKWSGDIPTKMPAQNLTIEASWKINQYTLTIKYNDGKTEDTVIKQDYNTDIQEISIPTIEGYSLEKWSSDIPTKMPGVDLTIEAVWMCDVKYFVSDTEVSITGCNKLEGELIILDSYEGKPVTSISRGAFVNCTGITSIKLPNDLKYIGVGAFSGCSNLTNITIPNSVISIETLAFSSCTSLTSVTIPNLSYMGGQVFENCTNLTSVTILGSSIGDWTFGNCTSLTSVTMLNVSLIGGYAFANCTSLTSITIPNCSNIGDYAFKDCTNLTDVILSDKVSNVWPSSFVNCPIERVAIPIYWLYRINKSHLKEVTIVDNTFSGSNELSNCNNLTRIVIPNSVITITSSAFSNISNVTIYCEAKEKPASWASDWNSTGLPVLWGDSLEVYVLTVSEVLALEDGAAVEAMVATVAGFSTGTSGTASYYPTQAMYLTDGTNVIGLDAFKGDLKVASYDVTIGEETTPLAVGDKVVLTNLTKTKQSVQATDSTTAAKTGTEEGNIWFNPTIDADHTIDSQDDIAALMLTITANSVKCSTTHDYVVYKLVGTAENPLYIGRANGYTLPFFYKGELANDAAITATVVTPGTGYTVGSGKNCYFSTHVASLGKAINNDTWAIANTPITEKTGNYVYACAAGATIFDYGYTGTMYIIQSSTGTSSYPYIMYGVLGAGLNLTLVG